MKQNLIKGYKKKKAIIIPSLEFKVIHTPYTCMQVHSIGTHKWPFILVSIQHLYHYSLEADYSCQSNTEFSTTE